MGLGDAFSAFWTALTNGQPAATSKVSSSKARAAGNLVSAEYVHRRMLELYIPELLNACLFLFLFCFVLYTSLERCDEPLRTFTYPVGSVTSALDYTLYTGVAASKTAEEMATYSMTITCNDGEPYLCAARDEWNSRINDGTSVFFAIYAVVYGVSAIALLVAFVNTTAMQQRMQLAGYFLRNFIVAAEGVVSVFAVRYFTKYLMWRDANARDYDASGNWAGAIFGMSIVFLVVRLFDYGHAHKSHSAPSSDEADALAAAVRGGASPCDASVPGTASTSTDHIHRKRKYTSYIMISFWVFMLVATRGAYYIFTETTTTLEGVAHTHVCENVAQLTVNTTDLIALTLDSSLYGQRAEWTADGATTVVQYVRDHGVMNGYAIFGIVALSIMLAIALKDILLDVIFTGRRSYATLRSLADPKNWVRSALDVWSIAMIVTREAYFWFIRVGITITLLVLLIYMYSEQGPLSGDGIVALCVIGVIFWGMHVMHLLTASWNSAAAPKAVVVGGVVEPGETSVPPPVGTRSAASLVGGARNTNVATAVVPSTTRLRR